MQTYGNLGGNSGVERYEIGADFIRVGFRSGGIYRYDNESTGAEHVERMKVLAAAGQGLGTYISQHVRDAYALRELPPESTPEDAEPGGDADAHADPDCPFCGIVAGVISASIIHEDARTISFVDLRQFHPGHVLVIPRSHVADIRGVDDETAAALMVATARVARAVDAVFPNDGLSVWHSAGEGAGQEVPHLHFHVHPRRSGDDVLRVYPSSPDCPPRAVLDGYAERLRASLAG